MIRHLRLTLLILALGLITGSVSAHANLASAEPSSNARLTRSPEAIRLTFTEPVEPSFSRIRLLDLAGIEVVGGGAVDPGDPFTLILSVPPALDDGVYTVSWRVVSAADGHTTSGSYAFGIGMAAGTRTVIPIDETFRPEAVIARWLDMVASAATLGTAAFALLIWRPGLAQGLPPRESRHLRLMRVGWIIGGIGLLAGLMAQTANATGGSALVALSDGSAARLLMTSTYGMVWLARAAVWVTLGALLTQVRTRPALWGALIGTAAGLALLPGLVSHSRATGSVESLLNDMIHRVAASLWVGGLVAWFVSIWPGRADPPAKPVGRAITRFSNLARFYVLLLAAGGLFAAASQVGTTDALIGTAYGRALTVKGVLFALMIALAGVNLLLIERRLRRGDSGWLPVFRITVGAEWTLGAALLVMSALMASGVPSVTVNALRAQAAEFAAQPHAEPYFGMEVQGDVMVHVEIVPGVAGENEFIVSPYLLPNASAITDATRVRLRFDHLTANLGESALSAEHVGGGVYTATGSNLSIPGLWRVRVTLQRPGAFDTVADFEVTIPPP